MRNGVTVVLLLLTSGLPLMPTGPLLADTRTSAASGCNGRLIAIEQRVGDTDVADQLDPMPHIF